MKAAVERLVVFGVFRQDLDQARSLPAVQTEGVFTDRLRGFGFRDAFERGNGFQRYRDVRRLVPLLRNRAQHRAVGFQKQARHGQPLDELLFLFRPDHRRRDGKKVPRFNRGHGR